MQNEDVSAESTAALGQVMRLWLQLCSTFQRWMLPFALRGAADFGLTSSLAVALQELQADPNEMLRWSGDSLLDLLVADTQLQDQATLQGSIDMRPLCSFFALGLDPTLITPPHSTSPLQRARQQVRAMSDEQIAELEQRLT